MEMRRERIKDALQSLGLARKWRTMAEATLTPVTITDNCAPHAAAIAGITRAAFTRQYGSGDGEVALIEALRMSGDVVAELVALHGSEIVGHVMFSRATMEPASLKLAVLGPVCASVALQKRGIGTALIREGLARCKVLGFDAVALLGDPDYYARFGFSVSDARVLNCKYSGPDFQALELRDGALRGGAWKLAYPPAFESV